MDFEKHVLKYKLLGIDIKYNKTRKGYVITEVSGDYVDTFCVPEGTYMVDHDCFLHFECKKLVFPKSCKVLGARCCWGIKNLETVICKSNKIRLHNSAFYRCFKLKSFTSGTIQRLEEACFCSCTSLESFDFRNVSCAIGRDAFTKCSSLRELTGIKNYNGVFDRCCFTGCESIESITFNNNPVLREHCFQSCSGLKKVVFQDFDFNKIENALFRYCDNAIIYIPSKYKNDNLHLIFWWNSHSKENKIVYY